MNDPQNVIDLEEATADRAREGQRAAPGLISPEPFVAPPSFAEMPLALVKQRGMLAAIVGAVLIGLLFVWRNSRNA